MLPVAKVIIHTGEKDRLRVKGVILFEWIPFINPWKVVQAAINHAEEMTVLFQEDGTVRISDDLRTVDRFCQLLYGLYKWNQLWQRDWKNNFLNGRLPSLQCASCFNPSVERSILDDLQDSDDDEKFEMIVDYDDLWFKSSSETQKPNKKYWIIF